MARCSYSWWRRSCRFSSESISALQDIKFNPGGVVVTLDGLNGEGKVLAWSQAENAFVPVDPAAGGESPFVPQTTDTGKMDGHLIPDTDNVYDIGSATHKVRDMYISDASLWIGDDHKVAISGGKMRFLKRKKDRVPSGAQAQGDSKAQILQLMNQLPPDDQPNSFEEMELKHWKEYSRRKEGLVPFETIYNKDVDEDWEPYDAATESSYVVRKTNITAGFTKAFDVAVDNKAANSPQPDGSGNAFYIDGVPQPELRLKAGTYRFYQKHFSNPGHPLGFYDTEGKDALIPGQSWRRDDLTQYVSLASYRDALAASVDLQGEGYYVELVVDETLPAEFWYQCGQHPQMGWKVINEAAGLGGPSLGDQLVHVNHIATVNNDQLDIHLAVEDKLGGRIVLDLDNEGGTDVYKIMLDELLQKTPVTMNFEIFSKGTKPFSVVVENDGGDNTARSLKSFVSAPVDLAEGASQSIEVGEGQMMILFCDGVDWYYEIRSGL